MNRLFSISRCGALAGIGLLGFGSGAMAQGAPHRPKPIEFSTIKRDGVTTNLNQMPSKKGDLQRIDEQLRAPFSILDSANNAAEMRMPTPRLPAPSVNSRAVKKLLEKKEQQENWMFTNPEGLAGKELTPEAIFGLQEYDEGGHVKKKKTSVESFYERMDQERGGPTNGIARADAHEEKSDRDIKNEARAFFGGPALQNGPLSEAVERAKGAVGSDLRSSFLTDAQSSKGYSDFFSSGGDPVPQKSEAAVSRRNEFLQLLDLPVPAGGGFPGFTPAPAVRSPIVPGGASIYSSPLSSGNGSTFQRPAGIQGIGNLYSPGSLSLTPYQPPKPNLPQPGFQLPNRPF